ncbi:MAG: hypothetical protein QW404_03635 [Candidatus Nanoarchaeia archaeon]
MKKRGALELSVNTIVIIVIGVALLSLGLIFVKNLFGGIGEISTDIFGKADTEIGKLGTEDKFTVPTTINVKQGSRTTDYIFVGNDGRDPNQCKSFYVDLVKSTTSTVPETQVKAVIISQNPVTVEPGKVAKFVVQVAAVNNAPLARGDPSDPAYSVTARCAASNAGPSSTVYETSAFVINVQKGGGIFG